MQMEGAGEHANTRFPPEKTLRWMRTLRAMGGWAASYILLSAYTTTPPIDHLEASGIPPTFLYLS